MFDSSYNIRLTFNSRLKRARLEFRVEECFKHRKPPRELISRVEERFKEERNDGFIETYLIFNKRLDDLWAHLRGLEGEIDPAREIKFTIAQGGRVYSEIKVDAYKGIGVATISCKIAPKKMSSIPFNAFLFNVISKLEAQDFHTTIDRGQLRFLYLMLKNGQALETVKLVPQPTSEESSSQGFIVRINPQLHYATLHVFDSEWLSSEMNCRKLLRDARVALDKVNVKKINMNFLEGHSIEKVTSLLSKMQAFGYNMPYDLLIAYDEKYRLNANLLANDKSLGEQQLLALNKTMKSKHRRLRGDYLQIDLDPEAMSATLVGVDERLKKIATSIDAAWLQAELQKCGIIFGFEDYLQAGVQALKSGEGLAGLVFAKGKDAQAGQSLVLRLMNKEVQETDEAVDMRERQNHLVVHSGDLVAEVRYSDGEAGSTVLGTSFFARGSARALGVTTDDGIEVQHDSVFIAKKDGLLLFEGNHLSCQSAYVHKGSINLASGNLRFEGAVIVEGDIESGASVDINGTLVVKGSIDGAKVRCSGDLEVQGGVNTGKRGYVNVGGSAHFGFVENSVIQVKHNLKVQRSIAHSWIIAGGVIEVVDSSKGQILGGLLSSWTAIVCSKFGADQGHTTQCRIGSHYHDEIRLQRLTQRSKRFNEAAEENLRSVAMFEKPGRNLSDDQRKHYEYVKKNSVRYVAILNRLRESKTKLESSLVYNQDATLVVSGILDKNSLIWIGGKKILVPTSMRGVILSPRVPKGIVDIDQAEDFARAHPNAIVTGPK